MHGQRQTIMTKIGWCSVVLLLTGAMPGFADVAISIPQDGENVSSPFHLIAGAPECWTQDVTAMGYSLDSGATTMVRGTNINAEVTAAAGTHTLHVKAWGVRSAVCDSDVDIVVTGAGASSGGSGSSGSGGSGSSGSPSVLVSSPENDAEVTSPFALMASASTCASGSVTAMGYSLDNSSNTTIVNDTSIDAQVTAGGGAHTLHVKAWASGGGACDTDVAITVVSGSGGSGGSEGSGGSGTGSPDVPSSALVVSDIQALNNWIEAADSAAGSGIANGSTELVASPSLSGEAREFVTQFANSGGERYSVSFGADTTPRNFFYDAWVYLGDLSSEIANVEMDMNQTLSNGQTVIFGVQCDGYSGTWDYTTNAGSPQNLQDRWVHSNAACNPAKWSTYTWHHVQMSYSRDAYGDVTYHSVWLDGAQQEIGATAPSAFALGWGSTLLTNFQVDGLGSGGAPTVYLDNLTISRW